MKHFFEKTISILLVFVMIAGFAPVSQSGYAEDININSLDDLRYYGTYSEENGTVSIAFGTGTYVFNGTIKLEDGKNYVFTASGPDVCFSHGLFSGEMIFVPETCSLKVCGFNSGNVSPFLFENPYSISLLSQPIVEEETTVEELPPSVTEGEADGTDNGSYDVTTGTDGEENLEIPEGEEMLTEVFVKSFSTLALVENPPNLRAIVAQGPLSLNNVSFVNFTASEDLSGAAVSLESGSPAEPDSKFCSVSFKSCNDSEGYALSVAAGRTAYLENVSAEDCELKNNDGHILVPSSEIGKYNIGEVSLTEQEDDITENGKADGNETGGDETGTEGNETGGDKTGTEGNETGGDETGTNGNETDGDETREVVSGTNEKTESPQTADSDGFPNVLSTVNITGQEGIIPQGKLGEGNDLFQSGASGQQEIVNIPNDVGEQQKSEQESHQNSVEEVEHDVVTTIVTSELENTNQIVEEQITVQQEQTAQQQSSQAQTSQSYIDNAPKQSIVVSANWTDNNNSARRRPGKTQVSLYLNNSLYMNATLSAENNWTYTFSNLTPGYSYRVEQAPAADYATSYWTSGNTVYVSNQYTGAQPGSSTAQYPSNAVQSTSAPTLRVTPAPAATVSPVQTPVPAFTPTPTRSPVAVPTSEPLENVNRESSHAWIWIALLVVSGGAIAAVLLLMNRARKQREAQAAARERARKRAAEAEMKKAQADISEGVRRTQNAEMSAQRLRSEQSREARPAQSREARAVQSREGYSGTQNRNTDRSAYRNDDRRREAPRASSRDTEYKPKH